MTEASKNVTYLFYCKICGTPMRVTKKHAQTCGASCRVALSNIMRYGIEDTGDDLTEEEREEVDKKIAVAKGKEEPPSGILKKIRSKNQKPKDDEGN